MTDPVVRITGAQRVFRRPRTSLFTAPGQVTALAGVDLTVRRGERFGIVGESGSGKTTLLRALAGLDRLTAGTVEVDGRDVTACSAADRMHLTRRLQMVFQDPMGSLDPRMRVGAIVAEPLRVHGGDGGTAERVRAALARVGLDPDAVDRYPHQFSGGQRQRISLARAVVGGPAILLADEAVSALDVTVRAQVLDLLAELVRERSLTLVFVSHDLGVVRRLCERVAVMRAGEIVETGATGDVLDAPTHPYTAELVAAVPSVRGALEAARERERAAAEAAAGGADTAFPPPD
ncbi:ABC transporter ATP-binding protein [Nakamurella flavida]|uniref:ABC transporter ATP-binding protein n=1 Tax=Nakamurella flavida TaxID=363630 RepID=A0A938YIF7_9ACTN|nr:ABC transporter ATP-binding protein [Nakamurella flavida]MBM9475196.1 ABC transporter ATP-binding protein [Nakamurella flavida]MDP9776769.1 peptide/nickel transport system ATP-binding protein [Nakamurella flavida]